MGSRDLVFAAAIQSGSPSSLQQMAATAAALASVSSKAGEASRARLTKSSTAGAPPTSSSVADGASNWNASPVLLLSKCGCNAAVVQERCGWFRTAPGCRLQSVRKLERGASS